MKFVQYNLTGKVVKQYSVDACRWEDYPLGEKVRITTKAGKEYVGFWNTFIMKHQLPVEIKVGRYDLEQKTGELRKVEAILNSNPRWGTQATNKFVFAKSVKFDPDKDPFFKNWPQKNTQQNS